ncbi:MAG TPA: MobA/MobL family protein [Gallionella sp.]|nr:MobA/MobL family protein [Gallionella sp.]
MSGNSSHFKLKRGGVGRARKHAAYVIGVEKYSSREDVAHICMGNMPTWATTDPLAFWEAADTHERSNGRTYYEFECAIPRELTFEEAKELVDGWLAQEIGDKHPYLSSIHIKTAADGLPNIHCHSMFSDRLMDGVDRPSEQFFKRPPSRYRNKKTGELCEPDSTKGGGGKDRKWNDKHIVEELRERWEVYANQFLVEHGHQPRLDLRSNAAKGLGEPEPKIGPEKRKGDRWRDQNNAKVKTIRQQRRRVRVLREDIESVKQEIRTARRERAGRNANSCRNESGQVGRLSRSPVAAMKAETRRGRTLYRWAHGAAAGLPAIVDRGDQLSLVGKASHPKARALIELAKAKGWASLVLTGSDEFKRLAVREALRAGVRIANPELASIVEEEKKAMEQQTNQQTRDELARQWLMTEAPVTAIEASKLRSAPERMRQLFEAHPDARRFELIHQQKAAGVPEPLLGFHIDHDAKPQNLAGIVRHVGTHVWVEPHDRTGHVVPLAKSLPVRPGQRVVVQPSGEITLPDRENTPRP